MRKIFTPFRFALCAVCLLSLVGLRAYGQDQDKKQTNEHPNGIVQDWSRRHAVYPRIGPIQSLIAVQHDPRAILSWQEAEREDWHRDRDRHHHRDHDGDHDGDNGGTPAGLHRDWSISLGGGTTAPGMFPAKFTFDPTATPTCIISIAPVVPIPDFVVFTVNVAGGAGQPNIVAFQDLYSGAAGQCNTQRPTYFTGDTTTSAATFWSYNVTAADGVVSTSPALSLDGTKVAFVEKGGGTTAHFHVLAWNGGTTVTPGDGVTATNSQTVTAPKTITGVSFVATAPLATSGTASDLALNVGTTQSDTISSPFVDYVHDTAYVGNDSGTLFRIANVFCTISPCTPGASAAPVLDATWGGGTGAVATGCPGQLTGPVVAGTGNVFVGCSDGTLYGFTPSGSAIPGSPLIVGSGGPTGGIVDPPVVDVVNGFLYVVAGNSSGIGTPSVLVQAGTTSFTSPTPVVATLGVGGAFNLHAPYFNAAYFSSAFSSVPNVQGTTTTNGTTGPTSNWQIYEWADSGVGGSPATLYGVGFNSSSHDMTSGPASNFLQITPSAAVEFSPVTEFLNGSTDHLYTSALTSADPNVIDYNVTDFAGLFPNVLFPIDSSGAVGASIHEGSGTSAMVVDNSSAVGQASSVYFGVQVSNTAVKLTQSGLN